MRPMLFYCKNAYSINSIRKG
uniref:Uncharacterized protein n=1 Tax=Rhizophora mucronata TaxID=61149 RepID=A0A2P2ISW2_RHIMU